MACTSIYEVHFKQTSALLSDLEEKPTGLQKVRQYRIHINQCLFQTDIVLFTISVHLYYITVPFI